MTALCHCTDCQKWTGGSGSANIGIPTTEFHITKGTPKHFSRVADSGTNHTQYFCGSKSALPWAVLCKANGVSSACGSNLSSRMDAMEGMTFIKAGSLNDGAGDVPIKIEFFVRNRLGRLAAIEGAQQFQTME